MFDLMHTPDLFGWTERSDIEIVHISMIELSDSIGFGYDLSDTQDGLKYWRMIFIFCGKHPILMTRMQVSDLGPMCPLVYSFTRHIVSSFVKESVPILHTTYKCLHSDIRYMRSFKPFVCSGGPGVLGKCLQERADNIWRKLLKIHFTVTLVKNVKKI